MAQRRRDVINVQRRSQDNVHGSSKHGSGQIVLVSSDLNAPEDNWCSIVLS